MGDRKGSGGSGSRDKTTGTVHYTDWRDDGKGSSSRTSWDEKNDREVPDSRHTTVQKSAK